MDGFHAGHTGNAGVTVDAFLLPLFGVPENLQPKAGLFLHAIGLGMPAVTMYAALRGYSGIRLSASSHSNQPAGSIGLGAFKHDFYVRLGSYSCFR